MKPDWRDAPPWARWLAMDSDGDWTWFEWEPRLTENGTFWVCHVGQEARAKVRSAEPIKESRL